MPALPAASIPSHARRLVSQAFKAVSSSKASVRSMKASPSRWSHKLGPLRSTQLQSLPRTDHSNPLGGDHRGVRRLPRSRACTGRPVRAAPWKAGTMRCTPRRRRRRPSTLGGRANKPGRPTGARNSDVEVKRSHPKGVTCTEEEAKIEEDGQGNDNSRDFPEHIVTDVPKVVACGGLHREGHEHRDHKEDGATEHLVDRGG
jgi:hypothetical protein